MKTWTAFYRKINQTIISLDDDGCYIPFFRGQSDASWKLLPGIARAKWSREGDNLEENLYFDFVTQAGALLPEGSSSWANAFLMQHHGLPTRLLDWTETFSVALYFAIKHADKEAAIWILNPFDLNKLSINKEETIHPTQLAHDYKTYFIDRTAKLEGNVVAVSPLRHNPRVFHQHAGFTLHDDIDTPLEDLHPKVITKVIIQKDAFPDAWNFLKLAGVNEFTIFPDLDGLSRHLKGFYFY